MEFTNPPGRHEREWRHPAELAAEERAAFAQSSPPVGIIAAAVGGIGVLVAVLTFAVGFAVVAPYRPVTTLPAMSVPARQQCDAVATTFCSSGYEGEPVLVSPNDIAVTPTALPETIATVATSIPESVLVSGP